MKRNYTLFQQYISYVLLGSFFLQSCGGGFDNNPLIPIQEGQLAPIKINTQTIPLRADIQPLIDQVLTAKGGHAVSFYEEAGALKADVAMNAPKGFSKSYEGVDVYIEQGAELTNLSQLDTEAQERRIYLQSAHAGKPAKIVIYQGVGLMGGMKGRKKRKEKVKAKKREKKKEDEGHIEQIIKHNIREEILLLQQRSEEAIKQGKRGRELDEYLMLGQDSEEEIKVEKKEQNIVNSKGLLILGRPYNTEGEPQEEYKLDGITFRRQNVSGVGMQCFFNVMGLNPQEQIRLLRKGKDDLIVRHMIANEIVSASKTPQELPEELKKVINYQLYKDQVREIDSLRKNRNNQLKKQSSNEKEQKEELLPEELYRTNIEKKEADLLEALRRRSHSLEAFNTFLNHHIGREQMMVAMHDVRGDTPEQNDDNHTSIDAIAYINNIAIKIYQPDPINKGALRLIHQFIPKGTSQIVYLYHSGVHFQALIPLEDKLEKIQSVAEENYKKDIHALFNLRAIIEVTLKSLTTNQVNSTFFKNLKQIGQLLHDITWNENDLDCIRNKHGYRNRHKEKGNNINQLGVKLDFETLAHLKDLKEQTISDLLKNNLELVKHSLYILQEKVSFILYAEKSHLTEEQSLIVNEHKTESEFHNVDIGFLRKVSAYYHDIKCINNLIDFIKKIERDPIYLSLNLSDKIDRYWIGYLFVLIGETAKEISDYIRIEKSKVAEENIIRFLFGKLGHHRQKIKGNPAITYLSKESTLSEIKDQLEKAKPELEKFLYIIKNTLEEYAEKINDYETISFVLEQHDEFIKNLAKKINLNPLVKGKSHTTKQRIEGLENDIKELNAAKEKFESDKKGLEGKKETLKNLQTTKNIISKGSPLGKNIQNLEKLLQKYLQLYPDDSNKTITNDTKNDKKLKQVQTKKNCIKKQLEELEKSEPKSLQIDILKEEIKVKDLKIQKIKLQICLAKILNNKEIQLYLLNYISNTLSKLLEIISLKKDELIEEVDSAEIEAEIKSLSEKINLKIIQIRDKEKELTNLKEQVKTKLPGKLLTILQKTERELENLKRIQENSDNPKSVYAKKMCLGFLGQYLKELSQSPDFQRYSQVDILLLESINTSISTRHKTMHGVLEDTEDLIAKTTESHLLPWQKSYEALKIIMLNDQNCQALILELFPKIPAWNESEYDKEKEIQVKLLLMEAYHRLMKYDEVDKIFLSTPVQNFLNDPIQVPLFKLELYINYIRSLHTRDDSEKTKAALEKFWEFLKDVKTHMPELYSLIVATGKPQNMYAAYYFVNKDLMPSLDLYSLTDLEVTDPHDQLYKADNLLENYKCQEALAIVEPICKQFENDPTKLRSRAPSLVLGHTCYRVMSMYYRCIGDAKQALLYLDKADELLKRHENEAKAYFGGKLRIQSLINQQVKSDIYLSWGQQFMDVVFYDKEREFPIIKAAGIDKFTKSYKTGLSVIKNSVGIEKEIQLMLAKTYCTLATSKAYLGRFKNNESDIAYSEVLLAKAEELIEKLTNPNKSMEICELWIHLAHAYWLCQDKKKRVYCLARAENNKYWKFCAKHNNLPLEHTTLIKGNNSRVGYVKRLNWNQLYRNHEMVIMTFDENMSVN